MLGQIILSDGTQLNFSLSQESVELLEKEVLRMQQHGEDWSIAAELHWAIITHMRELRKKAELKQKPQQQQLSGNPNKS